MVPASKKSLVSTALGSKTARTPVWFLRQAGRYLPEYQAIRSSMSFVELCKDPAKAAEVTLQPLRRFDLDAAIIFSDILIPPMAMGQTLRFDKGHGPHLEPVVRSQGDLRRLTVNNIANELSFVGDAIALTKASLRPDQTMIGFAGAPFTVASYMIEGGGSKTYSEVKKLAFSDPATFTELLAMLVQATAAYAAMQIAAGADAFMLFDSWAGNLTAGDYRQFVFPATQALIAEIKKEGVPVIYYPGQGSDHLANLQGLTADVIAVDWRVPLGRAARILREESQLTKTLQGNLDPLVLSYGDKSFVQARVQAILEEAAAAQVPGHIFNVGHGVLPTTRPEAIEWAIEAVRRFETSKKPAS